MGNHLHLWAQLEVGNIGQESREVLAKSQDLGLKRLDAFILEGLPGLGGEIDVSIPKGKWMSGGAGCRAPAAACAWGMLSGIRIRRVDAEGST